MTRVFGYLLRRAVAGFFTVLVMVTLTFAIFWATPTQPALFVYPDLYHITPEKIAEGNHLLGTDRSKIDQYLADVPRLFTGNLGAMWSGAMVTPQQTLVEQPIEPFMRPAIAVTLSLVLGGAVLVLLFAVPLGALAGSRVGSWADRTITLVALIGVCTHPMVIGIIVRSLFHGRLHWAPPGDYCPLTTSNGVCGGAVDWAKHLILPWITFALLFLALYVRMVRASVAETLHQDFVRTARAKGASEMRITGIHVLPNASLRILTMIGMEIGTAIGVCIYIETAYKLPGLATLAVQTMSGNSEALDLPYVLAIVFVISSVVVIGNLIVDFLYVVLDPRAGTLDPRTEAKSLAGGVI